MPLLDEVTKPIDLSKRIDFPAGFSVTPPAAPSFSVAEVQILLCVGLSLLALLILGILKRKTVMFFLEDTGLNLAAGGLNVFVLQETDRGQSVAKSKDVHLTKLNVDERQFVAIRRLVELGLKGKSK